MESIPNCEYKQCIKSRHSVRIHPENIRIHTSIFRMHRRPPIAPGRIPHLAPNGFKYPNQHHSPLRVRACSSRVMLSHSRPIIPLQCPQNPSIRLHDPPSRLIRPPAIYHIHQICNFTRRSIFGKWQQNRRFSKTPPKSGPHKPYLPENREKP